MWAEPRDVDKSLRVLIVGSDRGLEEEFRGALSRVPDRQGTIYFVDSHREAVETARRRQPNLILVEIDRPAGEIAALAKELQAEAPDAAIAGAFVPDRLEQGQSEGATIIELLRAQVRDFVRRPLSTTELRAVLDRLFSRQAGSAGPVAQGRVAAFVSNKGGVGKSTLAVNVACGLALRHPDEVLLVEQILGADEGVEVLTNLARDTQTDDAISGQPGRGLTRYRPGILVVVELPAQPLDLEHERHELRIVVPDFH